MSHQPLSTKGPVPVGRSMFDGGYVDDEPTASYQDIKCQYFDKLNIDFPVGAAVDAEADAPTPVDIDEVTSPIAISQPQKIPKDVRAPRSPVAELRRL